MVAHEVDEDLLLLLGLMQGVLVAVKRDESLVQKLNELQIRHFSSCSTTDVLQVLRRKVTFPHLAIDLRNEKNIESINLSIKTEFEELALVKDDLIIHFERKSEATLWWTSVLGCPKLRLVARPEVLGRPTKVLLCILIDRAEYVFAWCSHIRILMLKLCARRDIHVFLI